MPINIAFFLWALFLVLSVYSTGVCKSPAKLVKGTATLDNSINTSVLISHWVQAVGWAVLFCMMPVIKAYCVTEEPFLYKPIDEDRNMLLLFCCDKCGIVGTW